jgi:hypothetical protein
MIHCHTHGCSDHTHTQDAPVTPDDLNVSEHLRDHTLRVCTSPHTHARTRNHTRTHVRQDRRSGVDQLVQIPTHNKLEVSQVRFLCARVRHLTHYVTQNMPLCRPARARDWRGASSSSVVLLPTTHDHRRNHHIVQDNKRHAPDACAIAAARAPRRAMCAQSSRHRDRVCVVDVTAPHLHTKHAAHNTTTSTHTRTPTTYDDVRGSIADPDEASVVTMLGTWTAHRHMRECSAHLHRTQTPRAHTHTFTLDGDELPRISAPRDVVIALITSLDVLDVVVVVVVVVAPGVVLPDLSVSVAIGLASTPASASCCLRTTHARRRGLPVLPADCDSDVLVTGVDVDGDDDDDDDDDDDVDVDVGVAGVLGDDGTSSSKRGLSVLPSLAIGLVGTDMPRTSLYMQRSTKRAQTKQSYERQCAV